MSLIVRGASYKQVALDIDVSASTVRTHVHKAMQEIGATDSRSALLIFIERGWLKPQIREEDHDPKISLWARAYLLAFDEFLKGNPDGQKMRELMADGLGLQHGHPTRRRSGHDDAIAKLTRTFGALADRENGLKHARSER